MADKNWHVIGIMSGTSLDGVDLVYVKISRDKDYSFEILETKSVNYSEKWKNNLQEAFAYSGEKLSKLHADYGVFLGALTNDFIAENNIKNLDFVASHGHTIFHDPDQNYTLQIGSGAHMAAQTGVKVICDFRVQDVALGGQGAPLVPIGDQLLFAAYDFCLNLGGFANISYQKDGQRLAYDICPANIVLNHFTRLNGFEYDDKGAKAAAGRVNEALLNKLNELPYYDMDKPKSLGYEFIVDTVLPLLSMHHISLEDMLRTNIEHMAVQIADDINEVCRETGQKHVKVLVTGGGAYNDFMMQRIQQLTEARIIIPEKEIVEFKEALIFAFLGVLKEQGEVNCLKSVTGAGKDHSSGVVYTV